jgi:hypothetical protein
VEYIDVEERNIPKPSIWERYVNCENANSSDLENISETSNPVDGIRDDGISKLRAINSDRGLIRVETRKPVAG